MHHLQLWQWPIAIFGALLIGLSKTGIPGVGIFTVALFAVVYPPMESVGLVLPLLICGDIVAVKSYHRHAVWSHLWRLFPWAAAGIIIGYFAMLFIDKAFITKIIGGTFLVMVALLVWRKYYLNDDAIPHGHVFAGGMGVSAGFATMVANAAGPVMQLYLLAMQLPKMEFIGTGAWYFFILNSFKVPFQANLGNINAQSLLLDLMLAPFVLAGTLWGRVLLPRLNQRLFENLALGFAVIAGLKLILF
jgi:uncharacterized membrane protein YfcA